MIRRNQIDSSHPVGTEAWAKELYKRVESNAKNKAKGYVVEVHKASFSVFGIMLEYPADRASVIEELNQTRNCILHNQGAIDDKAAKICPRLVSYLGAPIPPSDPIFLAALEMLVDYTFAWVSAIVSCPYLGSSSIARIKSGAC